MIKQANSAFEGALGERSEMESGSDREELHDTDPSPNICVSQCKLRTWCTCSNKCTMTSKWCLSCRSWYVRMIMEKICGGSYSGKTTLIQS